MSLRIVLTDAWSWPEVRRGGERYLHELAAALLEAGHHVSILTTGERPGRVTVLGVPVTRVGRRHPAASRLGPTSPELAFGAQALVRLGLAHVDVWHATSIPDGAAAAFAGRWRPGLRTVFTDHGFPVVASRRKRPDWRLQELLARHIGAYVCVSHAAAGWLDRDYARSAVVVPPGVDLRRFRPAHSRQPKPTVLYSGSITEPRKNVALLLEAFALLRRKVPDAELWLLGPGNADSLLDAAPASAREGVTRVGAVDDDELAHSYATAWVTVLPSHAESFGMTVIESWASGTPAVVLTDSGGPAEVMREGLGVQCAGAPDALAAALESSFTLTQQADIRDACRQASEAYDWRRSIVPRMEAVYAGELAVPT